MAKYYGMIGYGITKETKPGIWEECFEERPYYGDVIRNTRYLQTADRINDDFYMQNQISILADPYAVQNFAFIKYAVYMGVKWKVTSVDVEFPRLVLTLGGVYNA